MAESNFEEVYKELEEENKEMFHEKPIEEIKPIEPIKEVEIVNTPPIEENEVIEEEEVVEEVVELKNGGKISDKKGIDLFRYVFGGIFTH